MRFLTMDIWGTKKGKLASIPDVYFPLGHLSPAGFPLTLILAFPERDLPNW